MASAVGDSMTPCAAARAMVPAGEVTAMSSSASPASTT